MKTPYDYQRTCIDALYQYWQKPKSGNGLLVIPTGGGKSLVIALIIKELLSKWPDTRILILTHVAELIEQNFKELLEEWPDAPAGIFSAGLGRKDLHEQILFAGIQSLEKHAHRLDPAPQLVFIDEAHLISRNDSSRYRSCIQTLSLMFPDLRVTGLTATPYRMDSGWLHKGENNLFDDIVYDVPIQLLIDKGHLVPVIAKRGDVTINTSGIHTRGGEYIQGELEARAMEGDTTDHAVRDIIERGRERKSWLLFTTGIKHATQARDALQDAGILVEMVTGLTPKKTRARYVEEHKSGAIRALVCVDTLTTGYNNPRLDLIANLRPTKSPGLWVQMLGRGTRTAPGKTNCLLLDYTDNAYRIGPIDAIDPEPPSKGGGTPPAKECPNCNAIIAAGFRNCPYCGHLFPPPEPKIEAKPREAPILKSQITTEERDVTFVKYNIHLKEGKPPSVKIDYTCGLVGFYSEWVFPERTNEIQAFYYAKFMQEMGLPYELWPKNAEEFLDKEETLPKPKKIWVRPDGKYIRVTRREYD